MRPIDRLVGIPVVVSPLLPDDKIVVIGDGTPLPSEWAAMTELERDTWAMKHAKQLVVASNLAEVGSGSSTSSEGAKPEPPYEATNASIPAPERK